MSIASVVFHKWLAWMDAEEQLQQAIHEILTLSQQDMYSEYIWDHYDSSIEFKECQPDFDLARGQIKMIWKLGFVRCWICYRENDPINPEKYYYKV